MDSEFTKERHSSTNRIPVVERNNRYARKRRIFFFFFDRQSAKKRHYGLYIYIYIYISKNLFNNKENNAPMYTGSVLQ